MAADDALQHSVPLTYDSGLLGGFLMQRVRGRTSGFRMLGFGAPALLALAAAGGCSSDETTGGSGGGGPNGECWPTNDACYVAGPSGPGAECLAKADNSGKTTWTMS